MSISAKSDLQFKLLIVGNSGVGKSSMLVRYTEGYWLENYTSTIGIDFKAKKVVLDDRVVKLQIWDTAGQERFRNIISGYYRGAHGVIFVYDITDRDSFEEITNWVKGVCRLAGDDIGKLLVGNKADLQEQRQISYKEGKELADQLGMKFIETSVKNSEKVDDAFRELAIDLVNRALAKPQETQKSPSQKFSLSEKKLSMKKKLAKCCSTAS